MDSAEAEQTRLSGILNAVASKGLIGDQCPSIDVFDLDYFDWRLDQLQSAFKEEFITNAIAVKANPIRGILLHAAKRGLGVECASIAEVVHALELNFAPDKIIYGSLIKTRPEMETALNASIVINLDNDKDIRLMDSILKSSETDFSQAMIGLRINPAVGSGSFGLFSTGTKTSKFGLPITDDPHHDRLLELYRDHPWLNGVQYHIGSNGLELPKFILAAQKCYKLVKDIENICGRKIKFIDIGGGLSSCYGSSEEPDDSTYALYRTELESSVPDLFSGQYRLITEFGRSLMLKAGKTMTRVEHVKDWIEESNPIILSNVGSNQFIPEAYMTGVWHHRFSLGSKEGLIKPGLCNKLYDVAGPLCFQGDFIDRDVKLPDVDQGDILIIHDTGAYAYAQYSKFNSILASAVYGFKKNENGSYDVICFKERETPKEALAFWGNAIPKVV